MLVVPAKVRKVWTAERASSALEAFLPFTTRWLWRTPLVPSSPLAPIELQRDHDASITLDTGIARGAETGPAA
jgi:hypothetical protein